MAQATKKPFFMDAQHTEEIKRMMREKAKQQAELPPSPRYQVDKTGDDSFFPIETKDRSPQGMNDLSDLAKTLQEKGGATEKGSILGLPLNLKARDFSQKIEEVKEDKMAPLKPAGLDSMAVPTEESKMPLPQEPKEEETFWTDDNKRELYKALVPLGSTLIGYLGGGLEGGAAGAKIGAEQYQKIFDREKEMRAEKREAAKSESDAAYKLAQLGISRERIEIMKKALDVKSDSKVLDYYLKKAGFETKKEVEGMKQEGAAARAAAKAKADAAKSAAKGTKLKQLPTSAAKNVSEGLGIPKLLGELGQAMDKHKNIMGPVVGRAYGYNPWSDIAQGFQSQIRTTAQLVGKFMEGGVLRKEDEAKYADMLPNMKDTYESAVKKMQIVKKMLLDKVQNEINAYQATGYDVSGLQKLYDQINIQFSSPEHQSGFQVVPGQVYDESELDLE